MGTAEKKDTIGVDPSRATRDSMPVIRSEVAIEGDVSDGEPAASPDPGLIPPCVS